MSLKTGSDSPVKIDSFTEKSFDWMIIPSALMDEPSSKTKRSPTTNSSLLISIVFPLRMTLHLACVISFSLANAFLLREF